jgi:hypothetical protein
MHPVANLVAGAVLLLLGRKLFWLFVAIAGFYVGIEAARALLGDQPAWLVWLVAIAAGLIGAILAMLFQRVGFALAGFYAGAYIALAVAGRFAPGAMGLATLLIGGFAGAVVAALVMDWAIIALSCLVGAALVVPFFGLGDTASLIAYVGLVALGMVVQAQFSRGGKLSPPGSKL